MDYCRNDLAFNRTDGIMVSCETLGDIIQDRCCWRISFDIYELTFLLSAQIIIFSSLLLAKSSDGYSAKSQFFYSIAFALRYFNPLTWEISPTSLCISKSIHYFSIFITVVLIPDMYRKNQKSDRFSMGFIFCACCLLAVFINTGMDVWSYLWCLGIYLEAVAILPQTYVMTSTGFPVSSITFYYTFMSIYKILHFASVLYVRTDGDYSDAEKIDMAGSAIQLLLYSNYYLREYYIYSSKKVVAQKPGVYVLEKDVERAELPIEDKLPVDHLKEQEKKEQEKKK